MAWRKCPRCELNYIEDAQSLCSVCMKETMGMAMEEDFSEMCIVCGERKAIQGGDLCLRCMESEKLLYDDELEVDSEAMDSMLEKETEEELAEDCEESVEIPLEELAKMEDELGRDDEEEEA